MRSAHEHGGQPSPTGECARVPAGGSRTAPAGARILCPDGHPDRWSPDPTKRGEAFASVARALRDEVLVDPAVRRVLVLVGPPGSGKSTTAAEMARGRGPLRPRSGGTIEFTSARAELPGTGDVIVDACHAVLSTRTALAKRIRAAGKTAIAVVLTTPLHVCIERDAKRDYPRRVGAPVIEEQHRSLRHAPPVRSEGWSEVVTIDGLDASDLLQGCG